jgi:hypothetical protein
MSSLSRDSTSERGGALRQSLGSAWNTRSPMHTRSADESPARAPRTRREDIGAFRRGSAPARTDPRHNSRPRHAPRAASFGGRCLGALGAGLRATGGPTPTSMEERDPNPRARVEASISGRLDQGALQHAPNAIGPLSRPPNIVPLARSTATAPLLHAKTSEPTDFARTHLTWAPRRLVCRTILPA